MVEDRGDDQANRGEHEEAGIQPGVQLVERLEPMSAAPDDHGQPQPQQEVGEN